MPGNVKEKHLLPPDNIIQAGKIRNKIGHKNYFRIFEVYVEIE